ncbi:hypothetical protein E2C01_067522 [Portunus trituberculatus]|uniref:Uncharacterized protein n=1 Tax=Portunus trituberculatus TaxID=210409 RepID=A0A5B7HK07_PORTR|nr:hypothetical protein [Portunus trituberculatus]
MFRILTLIAVPGGVLISAVFMPFPSRYQEAQRDEQPLFISESINGGIVMLLISLNDSLRFNKECLQPAVICSTHSIGCIAKHYGTLWDSRILLQRLPV